MKFRGGGVKKRQTPDFRSPEVGISVSINSTYKAAKTKLYLNTTNDNDDDGDIMMMIINMLFP